eukprot:2677299-Pleurochrysis_carterae.AAC.1
MARSPILNMISIIGATGTTLNIAPDRIHPIGSWGLSHKSLHQRRPALPMTQWGGAKTLSQSVIPRYPKGAF